MKKWLVVLMIGVFQGVQAQDPLLIDLASEVQPGLVESEQKALDSINRESQDKVEAFRKADQEQQAKPAPVMVSGLKDNPAAWGYLDQIAPRFWGKLDTRYQLCEHGKSQSPINLRNDQAVSTAGLPDLDISYRDVPLRLILSDHGLKAEYPLGSYIRLGQKRYELVEYVFRTPSEHQLEGFAYPMEIQMVHRDGEGNHAVMSVIVREGKTNQNLALMLNNLPKEKNKLQVLEKINFNPNKFLPTNKLFYRYVGSLTTPPCTEGTVWIVFKEPIEASVSQLVQFNDVMGENARPVQSLYGRLPLKSWSDVSAEPKRGVGYYFEY